MAALALSSLPPLLRLPQHIRKRIYFFSDLVRECPVIILPRKRARLLIPREDQRLPHTCAFTLRQQWLPNCVPHYHVSDCFCPDFPKQLLLVCKALHREVQEVLYSENKFVLVRHGRNDVLKVISMLSGEALCSLRHLLVRLNSWPCDRGHSEHRNNNCSGCFNQIPREPNLSAGDERSDHIIDEWEAVCKVLSHIPPNRLHLEFICDVGQVEMEMAHRLLEPMNSIPRLKGCTIRLARKPNYALQTLARETVTRLTATWSDPQPFRFSELPQEIRLRILCHTNLGLGGSFNPVFDTIILMKGKYDHREVGDSNSHEKRTIRKCCLECSFTKLHCSCPLRTASYNPYCRCRTLPMGLFLVSRQMSRDAFEVLYSVNTFRFRGSIPHRHFGRTINMLSKIPSESLKRLRCLEFDLPFSGEWVGANKSDWRRLLRLLADHCGHSRLFVKITVDSYDHERALAGDDDIPYFENIMRSVYAAYVDIVRSIKESGLALQDFHLFLPLLQDLEPVLERFVMGPNYDSKKRIHDPEPPPWCRDSPEFHAIPKWHKDL